MATILDIWMGQKEFFYTKSIEQIISISGDGVLLNDNETSNQFRELIANLPAPSIRKYISECLSHSFSQSGLVLQDLVNEVGRRLGFVIEPGFYRGGKSKIGFDGIWRGNDGHAFVIEVKTTDAYQINLDTQALYRQRLVEENRIEESLSSILLIVGRTDTGGLEAQTRGSRHAWDTRIINVDALLKLMLIKENLSDTATVTQIQTVLKPLEYTRVDHLIDIIFTTSEDLQNEDIVDEPEVEDDEQPKKDTIHTSKVSRVSSRPPSSSSVSRHGRWGRYCATSSTASKKRPRKPSAHADAYSSSNRPD